MKAHPYDENYRIISDWIMFREGVLENKVSYKHIPVVISSFDMYGISSNSGGMNEINDYLSKKDK
jgi:hypothetical protein